MGLEDEGEILQNALMPHNETYEAFFLILKKRSKKRIGELKRIIATMQAIIILAILLSV